MIPKVLAPTWRYGPGYGCHRRSPPGWVGGLGHGHSWWRTRSRSPSGGCEGGVGRRESARLAAFLPPIVRERGFGKVDTSREAHPEHFPTKRHDTDGGFD
jgi:hypothetical protein